MQLRCRCAGWFEPLMSVFTGFKFNFFDSLLKLASGIIFYLLNLSANLLFTLTNTVKCGFKP